MAAAALAVSACHPDTPDQVVAADYDAVWLWAGVPSSTALDKARTIYLLDGEIRARNPARYIALRPGIPHLPKRTIWLVVRTDTLDWSEAAVPGLIARIERWRANGNQVAGLQIDFDARTRHLDEYRGFLTALRHKLPPKIRLSITGLMDWSAHGDPQVLAGLASIVDEVVIQTYQGRSTIPGYERYFQRLGRFPIPFRVGLVEGGMWVPPGGLQSQPNFRGYVVFLVRSKARGRAEAMAN